LAGSLGGQWQRVNSGPLGNLDPTAQHLRCERIGRWRDNKIIEQSTNTLGG